MAPPIGYNKVPPAGYAYIASFSVADAWRVEWVDANDAVTELAPVVGFVFWQDANLNLRVDPICWYGPVFPEQQASSYRIISPGGQVLYPEIPVVTKS